MKFFDRLSGAWRKFWFQPASAKPLAALRIGLAVTLIAQVILLKDIGFELLSRDGIVQGILADQLASGFSPRIGLLASSFSFLNFSESTWITLVVTGYTLSLTLMMFGLMTRAATLFSWFFHWMLMSTAFSTAYGVDLFAHVFLFYLIWMPSGHVWSLDSILNRALAPTTISARLSLRVLQLHLCLMYFSSGLEKSFGPQWWNGELMWRALTLPVYRTFNFEWLVDWPHLAQILGIGTLIVEVGYFIFIWPKTTRRIWIAAVVSMHLGIAIFLALPLFGITMSILTLAVFGVSSEPSSDSWQVSAGDTSVGGLGTPGPGWPARTE